MIDSKLTIKALNGVRGYAALAVLIGHCSFRGMFDGTYYYLGGIQRSGGVYVFLVLSAFLLSARLNEVFFQDNKPQGILNYFYRRLIRIIPLYYIVLVVYYAASTYTGKNVIIVTFDSLFESMALHRGYGVFWAIPVEFLSYFCFPVFVILLRLISHQLTRVVVGICITCFLFYMIPNLICDQWFYFQGVFLSGITLYEVYKLINETNSNAWGVIGFIAGVVGVLIQLALLPCGYNFLFSVVPENTFLETQFELSSIIACCFILAACKSKWVFKGLCEVGLLQYLGKISYSLYLWHWLIINTVLQIKFNSYAQGVVAMVLSIIIAHISFRFIEEPFMKSKYLKSQWDKIWGID